MTGAVNDDDESLLHHKWLALHNANKKQELQATIITVTITTTMTPLTLPFVALQKKPITTTAGEKMSHASQLKKECMHSKNNNNTCLENAFCFSVDKQKEWQSTHNKHAEVV